MPRKVKMVRVNSKFPEHKKITSEEFGDIMCWRDIERTCTSDCAAWVYGSNKVFCAALPRGSAIADVSE